MRPAKNELVLHLSKLENNLSGEKPSTVALARKICTKYGGENQDYTQNEKLESIIKADVHKWISYKYENETYAIEKTELDALIEKHENIFLIVRNTELVFELKNKYERYISPVKVVTVYIYSDKKAIEDSYGDESSIDGVTLDDRKNRLTRSDTDYENAMALSEKYDETLIYTKKGGTGSASLAVKLNSLIAKYANTIEPYSIFFIQSFRDDENNAIELYNSLKEAAKNAWAEKYREECIGLLKSSGSYKIGETIWEMIEKSDFIVCDITPDRCMDCKKLKVYNTENLRVSANIWLELGYSLCVMKARNVKIGEKLLITCKKAEMKKIVPLPPNIQGINIIGYTNVDDFITQVTNHLKNLDKKSKANIIVNNGGEYANNFKK